MLEIREIEGWHVVFDSHADEPIMRFRDRLEADELIRDIRGDLAAEAG